MHCVVNKYCLRIFFLLLFAICFCTDNAYLFAQNRRYTDSLADKLHDAFAKRQYDSAKARAERLLAIAQKQNNEVALLQAELYGAMAEQERNPSAYNPNFFEQRIPKLDSLGLQLEKARVHKYVAGIYAFFGDVSKAIASHLKAQTYYESKGDLAGIASVYNDLSLIYYDQHDYDEAFRYAH